MREYTDISIEELDGIAADDSIKVPESLRTELEATARTLEWLDREDGSRRKTLTSVISIAASVALLIGIGVGVSSYANRPKDTFTDPYLAYQQLEETFQFISSKVEKSASIAHGADAVIERTNEILAKTNK